MDNAVRLAHRYLDDGIESIGGIAVAAGICIMDRSDLRKALDRNGRNLGLAHAIGIGARMRRFNAGLATKLGSAIVHPFDLDVFPRVTLSPEQRVERLERLVLSMPLGEQLLQDAYGGGGRR